MTSSAADSKTKKAKTDNFYSPANFAFYSKCPYRPLPPVPYHIRLLNVTREAVKNTFHYELTEGFALREITGNYTAISYCAGDPKDTRELMINGLPFNAFANLVQAIEETCHYLLDFGSRGSGKVSLWVDQVCINQSDPQERADQVSFMYEIYQSAFEVAVCLTTHDFAQNVANRESDRAIRCIEQVYKDVPHLDRFLTPVHDIVSRAWDSGWGKKEGTNCQLAIYLQTAVKDRSFALGWLDVLRMRRMPWFTRAWVLQEYASHQDVVFLYASQHVASKRLAAVLMGYLWSGDLPSIVEGKITQIHAIDEASLRNDQHGGHGWNVNSSWLTIHSYDQKVYNTLRSKSYVSQQKKSFIDLLDHSRMSTTTDKRDHIYSCLSLAEWSYGIQPYYKSDLSFEDLFTSVMRLLLLNTENINLIGRASTALGDHTETLPSWVPDWSQPITRSDAELYKDSYNDDLHAGGETKAHLEFLNDGKVLQTKGILLDTLVEEVVAQAWSGERVNRIHTFSNPRNAFPLPYAHISSKPPMKGDEVWILYGSAQPSLMRKDGDHYVFLRSVHVDFIDNMEVEDGVYMEFGVDLETETKTLRIR